jgi:hypothetical protein
MIAVEKLRMPIQRERSMIALFVRSLTSSIVCMSLLTGSAIAQSDEDLGVPSIEDLPPGTSSVQATRDHPLWRDDICNKPGEVLTIYKTTKGDRLGPCGLTRAIPPKPESLKPFTPTEYEMKRQPWGFPGAVEAPADHPLWKEYCKEEGQILMIYKTDTGDQIAGCDVLVPMPVSKDKNNPVKVYKYPDGTETHVTQALQHNLPYTPEEEEEMRRVSAEKLEASIRSMGGRTLPPQKYSEKDAYKIHGRRNYKRRVAKGWNPNGGQKGLIPGRVYTAYGELLPDISMTPERQKIIDEALASATYVPTPLSPEEKAAGVTIPAHIHL